MKLHLQLINMLFILRVDRSHMNISLRFAFLFFKFLLYLIPMTKNEGFEIGYGHI